jgi:hypothetical protein
MTLRTYASPVLHPAYKVAYFQKRNWPEEWITTAIDLMQEEWSINYKGPTEGEISGPTTVMPAVCIVYVSIAHADESILQASLTQKYFGSASNLATDPLETYLAHPPIPTVRDPIAYWQSMLNDNTSAPLTHMALDFLSTPGQSLVI